MTDAMTDELVTAGERWEVHPCKDRMGNISCYDICLPAEPNATGVAVVASVYSGAEVANRICELWNASTPTVADDGDELGACDWCQQKTERVWLGSYEICQECRTAHEDDGKLVDEDAAWLRDMAHEIRKCGNALRPEFSVPLTDGLERIATRLEQHGGMREALEEIAQWAEAYPADIFLEPDVGAVAKLLTDAGMGVQMDRLHASWARQLVTGIGGIARAALSQQHKGEGGE